jgi:NAD(P)-dependent dehydrogenase (short-subunit alcohol dehydrogenase family)
MDKDRHAGKVILVTGAASGIGRETALRFAREGATRIYLVDQVHDALNQAAEEVAQLGAHASALHADLQIAEEVIRVVDEAHNDAGRLDVVVANAATVSREPFLDLQLASWQKVIAVNLTAPFLMAQSSAKHMIEDGRPGVILFTGSVAGLGGGAEFAHYNASKAALTNLMKSVTLALVSSLIRVNSITVGPSDTPFADEVVGAEEMERMRRNGFPDVPLGRLCRADEVAAAFSFLASDDASYLTGTELILDGGLSSRVYTVPQGH